PVTLCQQSACDRSTFFLPCSRGWVSTSPTRSTAASSGDPARQLPSEGSHAPADVANAPLRPAPPRRRIPPPPPPHPPPPRPRPASSPSSSRGGRSFRLALSLSCPPSPSPLSPPPPAGRLLFLWGPPPPPLLVATIGTAANLYIEVVNYHLYRGVLRMEALR